MLFIDLKLALMVILLYKILYLVAVRNIFGPRGRAKWFKICDFLAEGPGKKRAGQKRPGNKKAGQIRANKVFADFEIIEWSISNHIPP